MLVQRVVDPAFFNWLASLDERRHGDVRVFNQTLACIYSAHDALHEWLDDHFFSIPDLPTPPIEFLYFGTTAGRRIFCAVLIGDGLRAVVYEVTHLQLAVVSPGIRTRTGARYAVASSDRFIVPDDGVKIVWSMIDSEKGRYLGIVEEMDKVGDEVKLRVDLGVPELAAMHVNSSPALNSLIGLL